MKKTLNIAIIEDNRLYSTQVKSALKEELSQLGKKGLIWEIECFESAKKFLSSFRKFDIICLDYQLDEKGDEFLSGEDLLSLIKSNHPDTHVIMMSGQEELQLVARLKKLGADHYLMKNPRTIDRIRQIVMTFCLNLAI